MTYNFIFSEIIDEAMHRLTYISGKRAVDADSYFRLAPCEADMTLFRALATEGAAWVAMKLGTRCGGFTLKSDLLSFEILPTVGAEEAGEESQAVKSLLQFALISYIIYRWLRIAGVAEAASWLGQASEAASDVLESSRQFSPLKRRPVLPI